MSVPWTQWLRQSEKWPWIQSGIKHFQYAVGSMWILQLLKREETSLMLPNFWKTKVVTKKAQDQLCIRVIYIWGGNAKQITLVMGYVQLPRVLHQSMLAEKRLWDIVIWWFLHVPICGYSYCSCLWADDFKSDTNFRRTQAGHFEVIPILMCGYRQNKNITPNLLPKKKNQEHVVEHRTWFI